MNPASSKELYGLVDMGSNGIRFSITNLSPPTTRSLPTLFQERIGISLYDAQYTSGEKGPISQEIIDEVVSSLQRFKTVCADFEVPETNIRVLATEATRTAINSEDYRRQIKDATGWEVEMLAKEQEGRVGAYGVASSFETVDGLVMDLGGGSTQITWMKFENGSVETSPAGSFSFPYGAAALTRLLDTIDSSPSPYKSQTSRQELRTKMREQFQYAFEQLELPPSLRTKARARGLTLYLSGGGFRGWGYLLMSQSKIRPYPIPIINGFQVPVRDFSNIDQTTSWSAENAGEVFRVSKRRAQQVPAVAFLINAIVDAFPFVSDVCFCQGGVREGYLFDKVLSPSIRSESPLVAGTSVYSHCVKTSLHIAELLHASLPGENDMDRSVPRIFSSASVASSSSSSPSPAITPTFLRALANTMYVQSTSIKESASTAALYLPITGVLSSSHGVSHRSRALLSLSLCQRWGGVTDLPPPHESLHHRLTDSVTKQEAWWAKYVGAIAGFIGAVYPSGRIPAIPSSATPSDDPASDTSSNTNPPSPPKPRLNLTSKWVDGLGKKFNMQGIMVTVKLDKAAGAGIVSQDTISDLVKSIEDMGKKKNRVGGKEYGFGVPVVCEVEWV